MIAVGQFGFAVVLGVLGAADVVTGSGDPRQAFTNILNLVAAIGATILLAWLRDLKNRTRDGQTAAADYGRLALKEVRALRTALVSAGVIDQRRQSRSPHPSLGPEDRGERG